MDGSKTNSGFDEDSGIWLEEFSLLLNFMFPVEYTFVDWYKWLQEDEAAKTQYAVRRPANDRLTGSRSEGFCIPTLFLSKNVNPSPQLTTDNMELWLPDRDSMIIRPHTFQNTVTGHVNPIFSAAHVLDDPRYVKLRLTNQFREYLQRFKDVECLNHAYMFESPQGADLQLAYKIPTLMGAVPTEDSITFEVHGTVYTRKETGLLHSEEDNAKVFTYPQAWPERAMEWLVRPAADRPNNWPSPDLIQEIFEAGCHIAPVGRGRRSRDPIDRLNYFWIPEGSNALTEAEARKGMDEEEWRISFSLAENKLAASVSPIQRQVMVLLKMLKKMYFKDFFISTYHIKQLSFWEFERNGPSFWNDNNTAFCLLFMLDRLIQCLKEGFLPHYIMPESNLLQAEDSNSLKKASNIVVEIRMDILQRTVSMIMRLHVLDYEHLYLVENSYLQGIIKKIQDKDLKEKGKIVLQREICSIFVMKYVFILSALVNAGEAETNEDSFNIRKMTCQSILARIFCKLHVLYDKERSLDDIVVNATQKLRDAKCILMQSKEYLHGVISGNDSSSLVPESRAMTSARKVIKSQWSSHRTGSLSDHPLELLQESDFEDIERKLVLKLAPEAGNLTREKLNAEMLKEIDRIINERKKN